MSLFKKSISFTLLYLFSCIVLMPACAWAYASNDREDIITSELDQYELRTARPRRQRNYAAPLNSEPIKRTTLNPSMNKQVPPSSQISAQNKEVQIKKTLDRLEFSIAMGAGYRRDEMRFSIAGNLSGTSPNILSELTWEDLEIFQTRTKGQVMLDQRFFVEGLFQYGTIFEGRNQDSDYAGDDRTFEFSRSNNAADGDDVWDASIGMGMQFSLMEEDALMSWLLDPHSDAELWLKVMGGYSFHQQHLSMTEGMQTIPATGPFAGLNSTYQSKWDGPWTGFELFTVMNKLRAFGRYEYHWAKYYAEADWNLRPDFQHPVSFTHEADGTGIVASIGCDYALMENLLIGIEYNYQDWWTQTGLDRTYFSDDTIGETQLNEATHDSSAISMALTYNF